MGRMPWKLVRLKMPWWLQSLENLDATWRLGMMLVERRRRGGKVGGQG